jgi:hypothetical protein
MIETIQETDNYISSFAKFEKSRASNEHAWLRELRRTALTVFSAWASQQPMTRNGASRVLLPSRGFRSSWRPMLRQPSAAELESFSFGSWSGIQLVFVNGIYSAKLSSRTDSPNGLFAGSLSEALESTPICCRLTWDAMPARQKKPLPP